MDKNLWNHIIILLLVLLVLSAFPEQKGSIYSIYMRNGKHDRKLVKKVQLDAGSEEGTSWGGLFRTEQNISQNVKDFFFF